MCVCVIIGKKERMQRGGPIESLCEFDEVDIKMCRIEPSN